MLVTITTSILANDFHQFFRDGKLVFQPTNKMEDERQEEHEATFKLLLLYWMTVSSQSSLH